MPLSVTPSALWDFQASSTPLVDVINGITLVAMNGSSVVSTANGLELTVNTAGFQKSGSIPSALRPNTLPITYVLPVVNKATGTASLMPLMLHQTSGGTAIARLNITNGASSYDPYMVAMGGTDRSAASGIAEDAEAVLIAEWTAAGLHLWRNATSLGVWAQTQTLPTQSATDIVRFGGHFSSHPGSYIKSAAIVHGALTSDDRDALAADWRTTLFGSSGPSAAVTDTYRRRCGLI